MGKCPVLGDLGILDTRHEDRTELVREIHNPAFGVGGKTPVNNSIPKEAGCVIIHHRYLLQNDGVQNAAPVMYVRCTVLDSSAIPMVDCTNETFTPNAIMSIRVEGTKKG